MLDISSVMKKYSVLFFLSFYSITFLFAQGDIDLNYAKEEVLYKMTENGDSLKLDVFLPNDRQEDKKTPVLVMIHGGAWVAGDRSLDREYFKSSLRDKLTAKGVAVISISYTLVHDSLHFPGPIEDCKDAIRWVRANATTYDFDTSNIGLWGESAGAHLALLAAYTGGDDWQGSLNLSAYSSSVSYVIDNFGPTDLNALLQTGAGCFKLFMARIFMRKLLPLRERVATAITGYSLATQKSDVIGYARKYSPLSYIDSLNVPTLILHGTKDRIVPFKESQRLKNMLDEHSVENELIVVDGGDHGFRNISEERIDILVDKTIVFICQQLNAKSSL